MNIEMSRFSYWLYIYLFVYVGHKDNSKLCKQKIIKTCQSCQFFLNILYRNPNMMAVH